MVGKGASKKRFRERSCGRWACAGGPVSAGVTHTRIFGCRKFRGKAEWDQGAPRPYGAEWELDCAAEKTEKKWAPVAGQIEPDGGRGMSCCAKAERPPTF